MLHNLNLSLLTCALSQHHSQMLIVKLSWFMNAKKNDIVTLESVAHVD